MVVDWGMDGWMDRWMDGEGVFAMRQPRLVDTQVDEGEAGVCVCIVW